MITQIPFIFLHNIWLMICLQNIITVMYRHYCAVKEMRMYSVV